MAKKHFLIPSRVINRLPVLRRFSWLLEAAVVKSLVALLRIMPPRGAYAFANTLFRALKPVLPFSRKIRRNLTLAFPDKDKTEIEQLTRAICGNLGRAAVDLALAGRIWRERQQHVGFVMQAGVDFAAYRHRPAVLVSGHIGAWQIGGLVAGQYGVDVTSVYAPEPNPYLRGFMVQLRNALPVNFISRDGCMRHLTRELRRGNAVGLVTDTRHDGGEAVDFFGTPTTANTAAARLALRHGCDLVPVLTERLDDLKFRVTVMRPIAPTDPDAPEAEKARQMTASVFKHFEAWIRDNPEQWMCFSRRWPKDVFGE